MEVNSIGPGDAAIVIEVPSIGDARIAVFVHQPEDKTKAPYIVIDIDTESESDTGETPMKIYRNDGPVYAETDGTVD